MLCRVRSARSGAVVLEFIRRDALAALVPALPIPANPDLKALPVGRREDGLPWLVKLHGTHVLIAGATGAGKASLLWGLVRAMFPLMRMAMPLAREVVKDLAVEHGACIRPIQLRRTNLDTGEVDTVLVPCGHTLAHVSRPAPNEPGHCVPRSAGKAGTSRTSPTSSRTRPPTTRSGGSRNAPKRNSSATRPTRPGRTRLT